MLLSPLSLPCRSSWGFPQKIAVNKGGHRLLRCHCITLPYPRQQPDFLSPSSPLAHLLGSYICPYGIARRFNEDSFASFTPRNTSTSSDLFENRKRYQLIISSKQTTPFSPQSIPLQAGCSRLKCRSALGCSTWERGYSSNVFTNGGQN